jgi:hypothetical protein
MNRWKIGLTLFDGWRLLEAKTDWSNFAPLQPFITSVRYNKSTHFTEEFGLMLDFHSQLKHY